jgi:hypothetical protein
MVRGWGDRQSGDVPESRRSRKEALAAFPFSDLGPVLKRLLLL